MSPPKQKKRSSILKKRRSSHESPEVDATSTKLPRKGILFSAKSSVKEFLQCDEKTTIWGNSYETSIARSDGSQNSADGSKKLSFDLTSSTFHTATTISLSCCEAEKENFVVPKAKEEVRISDIERKSNSLSLSGSSGGLSLDNLTIEINADEKKRLKKYKTDNLNITNMQIEDNNPNVDSTKIFDENMILSPRKPGTSVQTSKKFDANNIYEDMSFVIGNEENFLKSNRKTILQLNNMDLTLENIENAKTSSQPDLPKEINKPTTSKSLPKYISENYSIMNLDSPPVKTLPVKSQDEIFDEFMDIIDATDTPIKNVVRVTLPFKKHSTTPPPAESQPTPEVILSASKNNRLSELNEERSKNNSNDMELDMSVHGSQNVLMNDSDEMQLEPRKPPSRITLYREEDVDETLMESHPKIREIFFEDDDNRRDTVYNNEISLTCNFEHLAARKANSTLNCTNINITGVSSFYETTEELAAKTARLLRDPMAITASNSNLFSRTIPHEDLSQASVNIDLKETPIKDVIHVTLPSKKHGLTPQPSESQPPPKIIFSASKNNRLAKQRLSDERTKNNFNDMDLDMFVHGSQKVLVIDSDKMQLEPRKPSSRISLYREENIDETLTKPLSKARSTCFEEDVNRRETVYNNDISLTCNFEPLAKQRLNDESTKNISNEMDLDLLVHSSQKVKVNDTGDEMQLEPRKPSSRHTLHREEDVDETLMEPHPKTRLEENVDRRETVYNNDISLTCNFEQQAAHKPSSTLNCTNINITGVSSFSETTDELATKAAPLLNDPIVVTASNSNLFSQSIPHEDISQSSKNISAHHYSLPNVVNEDVLMEIDPPREQVSYHPTISVLNITENQTFIVKTDDCRKFMNITDAEIENSMLLDESCPLHISCATNNSTVNESGQAVVPMNCSTNNSSYIHALQDFVNLSIMKSPLNLSIAIPQSSEPMRIVKPEIPPPIDYCAKLDELLEALEKDKPPPRLEIDDFMEKMNVHPTKYPHYPQLEPDYLINKMNEVKSEVAREAAERRTAEKAEEFVQFPVIPDYFDLLKNKLECMDEEIRIQLDKESPMIAPVFPELRDFDFLLCNKFETDEHLSTYWRLEMLFAFMNQFKFIHKQMEEFKINISVRNSTGNLNDSTIPIYFEKVLLYTNPDYRRRSSFRIQILMKEFKRVLKTDNFTSMCSSTPYLYSFLEFYHDHVIKTVRLISNFFEIINKYGGILKRDDDFGTICILIRHFTEDGQDIVDLKILLQSHIEEVSIHNVSIKGHTGFIYELEPRQFVIDLKGLALIEVILFNVGKFLQDNTRRMQLE